MYRVHPEHGLLVRRLLELEDHGAPLQVKWVLLQLEVADELDGVLPVKHDGVLGALGGKCWGNIKFLYFVAKKAAILHPAATTEKATAEQKQRFKLQYQ